MEHTGHKSLDGVRVYKRSSEKQHAILSSILNNPPPTKKLKSNQFGREEELKDTDQCPQPFAVLCLGKVPFRTSL